MKPHSRYQIARTLLIFWSLFVAIGAIGGAMGMPFADVLFQNFTFSGCALLIINGVTNLTAAGLLLAKRKSGVILGGIFGVTLMLWICIQFVIFAWNFMSIAFFVVGFCQAATGYAAWVFYQQEHFAVRESDDSKIGTNPERLVVYFSRMGYVKQQALEEADRTGAALYEIRSTERTEGTLGFWWCGRYGMHRWAMPIEPVSIDLTQYAHVTICSPIWVFALAAPVRSFCQQASGKIKEVDYILVHHQSSRYENAAREMDTLLGIPHTRLRSIQCRVGKFYKK